MNGQQKLEQVLEKLPDEKRTLLLHSCCAPCSSYVLDYLRDYFKITVFYYNPNITIEEEYRKREMEQKKLIQCMNERFPERNQIAFLSGSYEPERFFEMAKGLENVKEGGERCFHCYELRLRETAKTAANHHFDYFATTLTLSPLKNAEKLNEIGFMAGEWEQAEYLPSDFKKKNGYLISITLSKEYNLYRQNYCGCIFSL